MDFGRSAGKATTQFRPNPEHVAKVAGEQVERDWATTLAVIEQAVKSFGPAGASSDEALQRRCEALWQWAKADEWTAL